MKTFRSSTMPGSRLHISSLCPSCGKVRAKQHQIWCIRKHYRELVDKAYLLPNEFTAEDDELKRKLSKLIEEHDTRFYRRITQRISKRKGAK